MMSFSCHSKYSKNLTNVLTALYGPNSQMTPNKPPFFSLQIGFLELK